MANISEYDYLPLEGDPSKEVRDAMKKKQDEARAKKMTDEYYERIAQLKQSGLLN